MAGLYLASEPSVLRVMNGMSYLAFELKIFWSFTASGPCAECFSSISLHFRLGKGRRERTTKTDDQSPCTSHQGNVLYAEGHFSYVFQNFFSPLPNSQLFGLIGSTSFQIGWATSYRYFALEIALDNFFVCSAKCHLLGMDIVKCQSYVLRTAFDAFDIAVDVV